MSSFGAKTRGEASKHLASFLHLLLSIPPRTSGREWEYTTPLCEPAQPGSARFSPSRGPDHAGCRGGRVVNALPQDAAPRKRTQKKPCATDAGAAAGTQAVLSAVETRAALEQNAWTNRQGQLDQTLLEFRMSGAFTRRASSAAPGNGWNGVDRDRRRWPAVGTISGGVPERHPPSPCAWRTCGFDDDDARSASRNSSCA